MTWSHDLLAASDHGAAPRIDSHIPVVGRVAVAATAFIVWDTIIHLADEIEYIWQGRHLWTKWCYIFVRHVPYLVQGTILYLTDTVSAGRTFSHAQCRDWIVYEFASVESIIVAVEVVLVVRVYAMYNGSKTIMILMVLRFLLEVSGMVTILIVTVPRMTFADTCDITSMPRVFACYWLFSLSFETLLFALTLVKFLRSAAYHVHRKSLFAVLLRDGVWAYAFIFAAMLSNTLMYQLVHNSLAGVLFFCEISVMSFAGSHVLLNLRRFSRRASTSDVLSSVVDESMIQFTSNIPDPVALGSFGDALCYQ
ncbi:hypothetical protein OBBRIDRAFT_796292 [Obba rivulosa]|uniref:DUF6533 domain-containing protein n=1 Tax=Obba rivulosa TaxID=1052685 RepID=A0A8E2AMF4_9APHY|nr:hypothetical protein OBBRIDRAFT_796292 [Obba rivulosa]